MICTICKCVCLSTAFESFRSYRLSQFRTVAFELYLAETLSYRVESSGVSQKLENLKYSILLGKNAKNMSFEFVGGVSRKHILSAKHLQQVCHD